MLNTTDILLFFVFPGSVLSGSSSGGVYGFFISFKTPISESRALTSPLCKSLKKGLQALFLLHMSYMIKDLSKGR